MRTFKLQTLLTGHTAAIRTLAFHPNGRLLASGSDDSTIRLWDIEQGQLCQLLLGHTHTVSTVSFAPNGKLLLSASDDQTISMWVREEAAEEWQLRLTLPEKLFKFNCVALRPDGATLISGSLDTHVRIWDVEIGELRQTLGGHTNLITAIDISPDGQRVISSSSDGTVRIWEIATGTCLCILQSQGPYAELNLTGVTGISSKQRAALKILGAIEQVD